jgi:ribose-phosphate pyrophosphokinase
MSKTPQNIEVHGFSGAPFAGQAEAAARLAAALWVPFRAVPVHLFPDGELMPVVPTPAPRTVALYASLDRPNDKLIALLLAADAYRRAGVQRLILVAPYIAYLRQDQLFHPGEPLSRDAILPLLGARFDRILGVDSHLHRTATLAAAFQNHAAEDLAAGDLLAQAIAGDEAPVIVGPDAESRPWAARIAERAGGDLLMFAKVREGDRTVRLAAPDLGRVRSRRVVLVDDICSSGATLMGAARQLLAAGARSVEAAVVHALYGDDVARALAEAGISCVISSDSVIHPANQVRLAPLLAEALRNEPRP